MREYPSIRGNRRCAAIIVSLVCLPAALVACEGAAGPASVASAALSAPSGRTDDRRIAGHTDAAYEAHLTALRERLPGDGFTIVIEKPFVVIGDESPRTVRRRAEQTVRWAVNMLRQDYFQRDPEHIIDIWLFRDEDSYRANAVRLFGREPTTPYGYYSAPHRALVMNIATGGGTLVHEIVHPFIAANFPDCPAWFNEGLGSLYEQCHERDGRIVGLTNWRLRGLQRAICNEALPSFRELTAMDDATFYGGGRGDNYAQARYLLYHLQERGLLREFYHAFLEAREDDPTGYDTLQRILGETDMDAFQDRWQREMLRLRFP